MNVGGRWRPLVGFGLAVALAVAFWFTGTNEWFDIVNSALITSVGAVALNLLLGHTGLVSMGNAGFLAIGSVAAAQVSVMRDGPFWLALVVGTATSALIGLLLAIPAGRIKGLYLAMGTLAFHFITVAVVRELQSDQVGSGGYRFPRASLFGFELDTLRRWYIFLLVVLLVAVVFARSLLTRKPGRSWRAIREQQAIAAMSGVQVWRYKVWAFVVSSAMVGFAGVLSGYYLGVVSSETFVLHLAVLYLAYVIIGGMGSMYGPIVGAFFLVSLPHLVEDSRSLFGVSSTDQNIFFIQDAAIGAAVVVMILVEPLGLARLVTRGAHQVERGIGALRRGRRGAETTA